MPPTTIPNRTFRRALLGATGLAAPVAGDGLPVPSNAAGPEWTHQTVRRLGFVQVDPISAVERAHHHVLLTRNPRYRHTDLERLLERDRALFENWTHDAAILPVELYPYWRHYMERFRRFEVHAGYRRYFAAVTPAGARRVLARVQREGPLRPRDIGGERAKFDDPTFASPTIAKLTLEWLWRTGKLAVCHRESRQKVYDLVERVIPSDALERRVSRSDYVDWACREALTRLVAATPGQVARFFDAVSTEDAARWCRDRGDGEVVEVRVAGADGSNSGPQYALARTLDGLSRIPDPPRRLRLLNPFDPLIHDRNRTRRVFGFDYTVEIWVPPSRRRYGYYVLPILEGDRFTGRLDAKADRKSGALTVLGLWWEPGVRAGRTRRVKLERELGRLAAFAGAPRVRFARGARS